MARRANARREIGQDLADHRAERVAMARAEPGTMARDQRPAWPAGRWL